MGDAAFNRMITGMRYLALFVCFITFAVIVQPKILEHVIPPIVDYSFSQEKLQRGVDLDPVYLSAGSASSMYVTGLYATQYGYLGGGVYGELITSDTRVVALNRMLVDYGSPLAPFAELFVATADDVGLDWRLAAAISGVESAFGQLIPRNSYNAWGWRGGPGGDFSDFDGWGDGIEYVTRRIAIGYGTSIDVFVMEPTYCPPCGANPHHAWANGVNDYMAELEEYRRNL